MMIRAINTADDEFFTFNVDLKAKNVILLVSLLGEH
jgi:hypothetical protein